MAEVYHRKHARSVAAVKNRGRLPPLPFRAMTDVRLTPLSYRLLTALMLVEPNGDGVIEVDDMSLGALVGAQRNSTWRAMVRLAELGYVERQPIKGRSTRYRIKRFDTPAEAVDVFEQAASLLREASHEWRRLRAA